MELYGMLREIMTLSDSISCALVLYFQPLLCLVGLLFNGACVGMFLMVYSQEYYRKTSLILYLVSLSVCNIFQLVLSFFVIVLPAFEQFMDDERYPAEYAFIVDLNSSTVRFAYPMLMAANYASIWILTLICAQRFQSICHPSNVWKQRLQFVRQSRLCIACSVLLALVTNIIRFWELQPQHTASPTSESDIVGTDVMADGGAEVNGGVAETQLRTSTLYKVIQEGFVYGFIVYCVPMCLLFWLNYNTFRIVLADELNRYRPDAEHRIALMTVCVFIFFFLFTTMSVTLRLIMILCGNLFLYMDYMWIVDLSNLLMNANALAMPVVCFVFTRGFRDLFFAVRRYTIPLSMTLAISGDQECCDDTATGVMRKLRCGRASSDAGAICYGDDECRTDGVEKNAATLLII